MKSKRLGVEFMSVQFKPHTRERMFVVVRFNGAMKTVPLWRVWKRVGRLKKESTREESQWLADFGHFQDYPEWLANIVEDLVTRNKGWAHEMPPKEDGWDKMVMYMEHQWWRPIESWFDTNNQRD